MIESFVNMYLTNYIFGIACNLIALYLVFLIWAGIVLLKENNNGK